MGLHGMRAPRTCNPHLHVPQADKCRKLLPRRLSDLPGGGLHNGSILAVADQGQRFRAELVLAHRVSAFMMSGRRRATRLGLSRERCPSRGRCPPRSSASQQRSCWHIGQHPTGFELCY